MNTFTARATVNSRSKTNEPVCTLEIETNALIAIGNYGRSTITTTIHADSPQELKDFCRKVAEAGNSI